MTYEILIPRSLDPLLPRLNKGIVCLEVLSFFEAPEYIKAQFETRF
jgi:hypothetical protein